MECTPTARQRRKDNPAFAAPVIERLVSQRSASWDGILSNIGGSGRSDANAPGASPGLVVAAPTKENPDYFYTWTRDSSLAFKALIDDFIAHKTPVEKLIQIYISSQAGLQNKTNPSGSLCTGGLGETRDSTSMARWFSYANYLLSTGHKDVVESVIWPIVQNDLTYVSEHWNETTYDLWESIKSSSMFATAVQYRALIEGNGLAKELGKECKNCESQAPQIFCFLQSYWTGSYMLANTGGGRSGIDVQTVLASVHIYDPSASCDSALFQPCSDRALANHKVVVDAFRQMYPMNKNKTTGAVAVGRYPEDEYFNGNPWYISNFGAAEQLYDAVEQWNKQGEITITSTSLAFFKDLNLKDAGTIGKHGVKTPQFTQITTAVRKYADGLMMFPPNTCVDCPVPAQKAGSMNEQFSRDDGKPLSAAALTWSNAAFLTAMNARNRVLPASWGASSVKLLSKCEKSSATGACSPPIDAAW